MTGLAQATMELHFINHRTADHKTQQNSQIIFYIKKIMTLNYIYRSSNVIFGKVGHKTNKQKPEY